MLPISMRSQACLTAQAMPHFFAVEHESMLHHQSPPKAHGMEERCKLGIVPPQNSPAGSKAASVWGCWLSLLLCFFSGLGPALYSQKQWIGVDLALGRHDVNNKELSSHAKKTQQPQQPQQQQQQQQQQVAWGSSQFLEWLRHLRSLVLCCRWKHSLDIPPRFVRNSPSSVPAALLRRACILGTIELFHANS